MFALQYILDDFESLKARLIANGLSGGNMSLELSFTVGLNESVPPKTKIILKHWDYNKSLNSTTEVQGYDWFEASDEFARRLIRDAEITKAAKATKVEKPEGSDGNVGVIRATADDDEIPF